MGEQERVKTDVVQSVTRERDPLGPAGLQKVSVKSSVHARRTGTEWMGEAHVVVGLKLHV